MKDNNDGTVTLGPVPRENAYLPMPVGGNSHNGSGNYEFPVTEINPYDGSTVTRNYRILAEQSDNAVNARDLHPSGLVPANPCIGTVVGSFHEQPCSTSPFAIIGCMNPSACNYDSTANCAGGATCYYPTATWWYNPDPGNTACEECYLGVSSGNCTDGVATCPAGTLGTDYYSDFSTCTSETGSQGPPPPPGP